MAILWFRHNAAATYSSSPHATSMERSIHGIGDTRPIQHEILDGVEVDGRVYA